MSARGWAVFIAFGMALGLGAGLLISWVIYPVRYVDTEPASLRADHRQAYLALIARAYVATGDLDAARRRLAALPEESDSRGMAALAQQALAGGDPQGDARALAALAAALDPALAGQFFTPTPTASRTPTPSLTPTPLPPVPTATPLPPTVSRTPLPPPTRTATPTPQGRFELADRRQLCPAGAEAALIQVQAIAAGGQPAPGVEVIVTWDGGQGHFFTGLKPELGMGYGDFEMSEGVTYSVRLAAGGPAVGNLQAPGCEGGQPGSWLLTYRQQP